MQRGERVNWSSCRTRHRGPDRVASKDTEVLAKAKLHRCVGSASVVARRVAPNPSVKRTRNGVAPGPRGRVVYPRPHGPGATPLRAAYLER